MGRPKSPRRAEEMLKPLIIRADASPRIGTGHVMRSLALAQAWMARGGAVYLLAAHLTPALEKRLVDKGLHLERLEVESGTKADAIQVSAAIREHGADWVVVDGYCFDGTYQRWLKEAWGRVLFVDDYGHCDRYVADLVLNQNIDAEEAWYANRAESTKLLLGPRYALLRKEFWPWRQPRRQPAERGQRVLVTLGGGDPDNVTSMVVRALDRLSAREVKVTLVVGGSSPHLDAIQETVEKASVPIDLRHDVDQMATLMAEADVAVSAGGSTCWELAFMGIPNSIIVLAANQRGIASGLDAAGVSINLGWYETVEEAAVTDSVQSLLHDDAQRLEMAARGQELVDGRGTHRILHSGLLHARKAI